MDWVSEKEDDCPARVWYTGQHARVHKGWWRSKQWEVEGMEEDSRYLGCDMGYFALCYPCSVLCEAPHKWRKLKHAYEFQEKFPKVLYFLRNFLRLKNNFSIVGGSAKFRTLKLDSLEFGRDWTYQPGNRLSFALFDLRDTLGHGVLEDHVKNLHFSLLLATLRSMKTPSISMPVMWLYIVNSANMLVQAAEYAKESFMNYTI